MFNYDDDHEDEVSLGDGCNTIYASLTPRAAASDEFTYDEDYDEFNLHMTPSSITSQDDEQLVDLELLQHDDVGWQTDSLPSDEVISRFKIDEEKLNKSFKYFYEEDEYAYETDEDFVEFEGDLEIMHVESERTREN